MTHWQHYTVAPEGQLMHLAARLDDEAHFGWDKHFDCPLLTLQMAEESLDLMQRTATMLGKPLRGPIPPRDPKHQATYKLTFTGWPALDVMLAVRPWLGTNKGSRVDDYVARYAGRIRRDDATHCKNGHEFTQANTYVNPTNGKRACIPCRRAWRRADYQAKKEAS